MSNVHGAEGKTWAQIHQEVAQGGKFIVFPYVMSFLIITLRRNSAVEFVPAGQKPQTSPAPYILCSLFLGWWGFPWGFIYTPGALFQCFRGGKDVTAEIMKQAPTQEPVSEYYRPPVITQ